MPAVTLAHKALGRGPRVDVEVTLSAIEDSMRRSSSHCMIATAIQEAIPSAVSISVDLQTIRFSNPEKRERYIFLTERKVQIALVNFDQGRLVAPFTFRLRGAHVVRMAVNRRARDKQQTMATRAVQETLQHDLSAHEEDGVREDLPAKKRENAKKLSVGYVSSIEGRAGAEISIKGGSPPPIGGFAKVRRFGLKYLEP